MALRRLALCFDLTLGFYANLARGALAEVPNHSDWLVRWFTPNSINMPRLREWAPDAVIADLSNVTFQRALLKTAWPVVSVGPETTSKRRKFVHIGNDNHAISVVAAHHLVERGLTNFAYVGSSNSAMEVARSDAFESEIRRVLQRPYRYGVCWGGTDGSSLAGWLQRLHKPVGILAFNDWWGWLVLEGCRAAGLSVPEEVAVVGIDNIDPLCHVTFPPMSSVIVAAERVGCLALQWAVGLSDGSKTSPGAPLKVPPLGLAVRQSSDYSCVADDLLRRALHLMAENVAQPLSVAQLARRLHTNRRFLERRFRSYLGRSPLEQMRWVQVQHACHLLVNTSLSIAEIAEDAGFANSRRFAEGFQRVTGSAPSAYRRARSALKS